MATIPRSLNLILESVIETHADVDPTIDIQKGPISVLLYTFAAELTRVESHTSYLSSVYQLENADELEDEDLLNLARNYGLDPDAGTAAIVIITFFRTARPVEGEVYSADEGTEVSTQDNRLSYTIASDIEMDGDNPDIYFNPDEQRYEVSVAAVAVATGTDYNVPAGTIVNLTSDIPDFDSVVNNSDATGGQDPLDAFQIRNQIWDSIQGLTADSTGRIIRTVEDINPNGFQDISLVASTDYEVFTRLSSLNGRQGYDIYLITDSFVQEIQSGVALGGETSILIERTPALAVEQVTVDGVQTAFFLQQDLDPAVFGSNKARDRVTLNTPLQPAQTYEIRFYYFDLVYEAGSVFDQDSRPFDVDILVRRATPIPVYVAANLSTTPSADKDGIINEIQNFTEDFFRDPTNPTFGRTSFITALDPASYEQAVRDTVNGVTAFTLTAFLRTDKAVMDVEIIEFDGYTEYPLLSPNFDVG